MLDENQFKKLNNMYYVTSCMVLCTAFLTHDWLMDKPDWRSPPVMSRCTENTPYPTRHWISYEFLWSSSHSKQR